MCLGYSATRMPQLWLLGLQALQHRGQEAAGIVVRWETVLCERRRTGERQLYKAFCDEAAGRQQRDGHVRYSTTGETVLRNVQPLFADLAGGGFALAHGNLTATLRKQLEKSGAIFNPPRTRKPSCT